MMPRPFSTILASVFLAFATSTWSQDPIDQVHDLNRGLLTSNPSTVDDWREIMARVEFTLPDVGNGTTREPVVANGVRAEWITPPNAKIGRVLIYLHGGGNIMCSARFHRPLVERIARAAGAKALNVDYRLAPEAPFPAAVNDACDAYRWLLARGVKPDQIVIAGDSAGGGLTIATLVNLRKLGDPMPAAAVCISPWVDLEMTGESMKSKAAVDSYMQRETLELMAESYLDGKSPRTPLASPLHADLRGLPPMLIHVGSSELLLSDSTRLAARAGDADVGVTLEVWPNMVHSWHMFARILPEGRQAIARVGAFVKVQLGERTDGKSSGEPDDVREPPS